MGPARDERRTTKGTKDGRQGKDACCLHRVWRGEIIHKTLNDQPSWQQGGRGMNVSTGREPGLQAETPSHAGQSHRACIQPPRSQEADRLVGEAQTRPEGGQAPITPHTHPHITRHTPYTNPHIHPTHTHTHHVHALTHTHTPYIHTINTLSHTHTHTPYTHTIYTLSHIHTPYAHTHIQSHTICTHSHIHTHSHTHTLTYTLTHHIHTLYTHSHI